MGQWSFDTAGRGINFSVAENSGTATLTQDAATCSYTSDATGSLHTSFLSNGLAVSAANVGGVSYPALLVASPESSLANIAGTYNVLRYTTEKTSVTTVTTDYMTFNVDSVGNWQACPNTAYSASCTGLTGTLTTDSAGGFDIILGGQTVGRLLAKVSGDSKVFAVAINNTADSSDLITGIWVGMVNTAFASGAYDGSYVTESTDPASNVITISGLTGQASDSTTPATLTPNTPTQGMFAIYANGPESDYGIASALGLYAAITPGTASSAYLQFGVKEAQ